jgi:hypothetical protein
MSVMAFRAKNGTDACWHTHAIAAASISLTAAPSDRIKFKSSGVQSNESLVDTTPSLAPTADANRASGGDR